MKKNKGVIFLIGIIVILLVIILLLLFGCEKSFTITFDSNGGTEISNIEVKNGEVVKLPENPTKEGHTFVGWTNEKGNVITKGTKVNEDITLKAEWVSNDKEISKIKYEVGEDVLIDDIVVEKGNKILFPVEPIKKGYIFIGWLTEDNILVTKDIVIDKDIVLKAYFIKEGIDTKTITFNTDGGSIIDSIKVENGKVIIFPSNPVKEGYVFAGWVDGSGKEITKDTVVNENVTIKATWKKPYTCPDKCTPIGDGSKCTREVTANMVNKTTCPSGYKLINGNCLDVKNQYHANPIEHSPWWSCNSSSEVMYTEIDESGMGALMWCAKKGNKTTTKACPSGYTKSGNICKKTETIKCKAN